jgi:hypothetical protein
MGKGMIEEEFLPLPYYPWDRRPGHSPIEVEEAATALYLAEGVISQAAERLRVEPLRLTRAISRSPKLRKLHEELVSLLNDKVHAEYLKAFLSDDDRRREWAASKTAQTKQFQAHPLAPNTNVPAQLALSGGPAKIIISWEEPLTIEHSADD